LTFADRIVLLLAEGLGLGRIPKAPGTFGSLWAFPLGWCMETFQTSWSVRLAVWLAMWAVGVPLTGRAAKLRDRKDPGSVVWDEITAFPLVYAFVPVTWLTMASGFAIFRFFDIAKPWPIRKAERLPGGSGIMADDQIAAAYSAACVWVIWKWMG
jgi:phosphatidylglycerophosphatase A